MSAVGGGTVLQVGRLLVSVAQRFEIVGAIGGASINAYFTRYFGRAAHYHFGLRRLARYILRSGRLMQQSRENSGSGSDISWRPGELAQPPAIREQCHTFWIHLQRLYRMSLESLGIKLGIKFRAKRIAPLLDMMESAYKECGSVNVVDIGGTEQYWDILPIQYLDKYDVHITIVNIPSSPMPKDHGRYKFMVADGCNLSEIDDNSFHIAHSNSVIEHVGDWQRMVSFAREISRVAQRHLVQTPNYWFPFEPHFMAPFFHWLPKPIRLWFVMHFRLGFFRRATTIHEAMLIIEHARLLTRKMFRELFPESTIVIERFVMLPKSFMAIKK